MNLRITLNGGVPVPVPWTVVLQNPSYVGRVQQARGAMGSCQIAVSAFRCLSHSHDTQGALRMLLSLHTIVISHSIPLTKSQVCERNLGVVHSHCL